MTESTLSSQFTDLQKAIAHYLGLGRDITKWTEGQLEIITVIIKRGVRQFYFPPRIYDNEAPYEWRFLKPTTTISTIAPYDTGTIAIANGATTVTLTGGVWPSWTATKGTLVVGNTEYAIDSRTNDTVIELVSTWTEDAETESAYVLEHDGSYDLPDDFGGIEGDMTYEVSENKADIRIVGEGMIRSLRRGIIARTWPRHAAVRPKTTDGSTGQRFEMLFEPIPDSVYVLSYRMLILSEALTATIKYHYGGMAHAETVEASCLAIAELQEDEIRGPKFAYFMERLTASIAYDKRTGPDFFGYNGDESDDIDRYDDRNRRCRHPQTFIATYNGEI